MSILLYVTILCTLYSAPLFSKNTETKKNNKRKIEEVSLGASVEPLTEEKIQVLEKNASYSAATKSLDTEITQEDSNEKNLAEDEHEIL